MIVGVCFTCFLMISTVTAIPQTSSQPMMNYIRDLEENSASINKEILNELKINGHPTGIIDLLKNLILFIIQIIYDFIEAIKNLIDLVNLIDFLIDLISLLVSIIQDLIDAFLNLFPSMHTMAK